MRIAVIPARGGSKRIPNKNIRPFHGKPIIAYSIEAARQSGMFGRIIVSTDDAAIAAVARRFGADVMDRPAALSDDHATLGDVMQHVTAEVATDAGATALCCILATAPFMDAGDLREAVAKFESNDFDYVFTAFRVPAVVQQTCFVNEQGRTEMFFPDLYRARSQDLAPAYFDAAHFYLGKPEAWLENRTIFTSNATLLEVPVERFHDIDDEKDWRAAERAFTPPAPSKMTA